MKIIVKYSLLILCIQLVSFTYAQSEKEEVKTQNQSEIGIYAGTHKSGFYGSRGSSINYKSFGSYVASAYYKKPISDKLFSGFELEYMHVKSNLHYSNAIEIKRSHTYDALINLDYINFHFLFGGELFSIKGTTISGTLSPYFGYLLYSKASGYEMYTEGYTYFDSLGMMHNGTGYQKQLIEGEQIELIRKSNIGMCLNLDASIPVIKKLFLVVRAGYNLGIYSVINESEKRFAGIRGYSFSVGLALKINKK